MQEGLFAKPPACLEGRVLPVITPLFWDRVWDTRGINPATGEYGNGDLLMSSATHLRTGSAPTLAAPIMRLLSKVTCPHCWNICHPEDILWISSHPDLMGDPVLGAEHPSRFLPSRFTVGGQALDAYATVCHRMACPRCHLLIPREVIENTPLFMSVIGGPGSGKSNFLAAMVWELRQTLPTKFALAWSDIDAAANHLINGYEEQLFLAADPDALTYIAKTEEQGDIYDVAKIGGQSTAYTRPFLFSLKPTPEHRRFKYSAEVSRVVCVYDNAGESYLPGADTPGRPVTQHLGKAQLILFLFDPTQDPRMRAKCGAFSSDPQIKAGRKTLRQESLLNEAAGRMRRYGGLGPQARTDRPLIICVSKSDIWAPLMDEDIISEPYLPATDPAKARVDMDRINRVSAKVRQLLLTTTPEIVSMAEAVSKAVVYVPISSLGHAPEPHPSDANLLAIRPRDIRPHWVTVPVLYALAQWTSSGLV